MTVPSPGVVFHLCLIVLACTHFSGGEYVPVILNGLINQSIPMSLSGGPSGSVHLVIWIFKTNPLVTYTNNQLTVIDEKFKGRLEILDDGRELKIGYLRLEDSGLYTGTITFTNNTNYKKVYNLSVYEPVPTPSIVVEDVKNTSDWCNVTFRCSVPENRSSLSYTWKHRRGGSDYQIYNNRNTIQMSLKPESWDTEVLCLIQNPADLKNDSLHKFCPYKSFEEDKPNRRYYPLLVLLVLIVLLVFLGWFLIKMKRKRRKDEESQHALKAGFFKILRKLIKGTPTVTENVNGEPQYIQVTTVLPNDDTQEWNNSLYDSSPRQKPKALTVYATLEHPPETKR
ncbi:CD48 antigen-like isoform X2 [Aquarana catesbeiana]|uniref:CD48 antigen-like isoform X2 n=1 Tax=Aquarana catesbeiana TaxID=8400 RepID=UPI003CC96869